MADKFKESALEYHKTHPPGKLSIVATKPLANQRDLALAYSPGVAAACELIADDPETAADVTSRGNLVGVISNGTAVLGLGAIGPLASKPVMEGKAVLFKKFAGIDVFDIEIDEKDPKKLIDIIASLEPTFGGINLEDIKAPECFEVESALKKRMNIPVFHDDQHGTAIIVAAAIVNGLDIVEKKLSEVKVVVSGAGAAAIACLELLMDLGVQQKNIWVTDLDGVVYKGRKNNMDSRKSFFAQDTKARTLDDVIDKADIFLGLSAPGVLKAEMVKKMADKPLIFALANPVPEIYPEEAKKARPDAILATGRTDYPNQVNNVLCFPFIFRGALDVGATTINEEMKKACVYALANLARVETSDVVTSAYGGKQMKFGPEYLIPKPFDPRLILELAPAVAKAAIESKVAKRPIKDFNKYKQKLTEFVFKSGLVMKPIFSKAKSDLRKIVFAEGEELNVLHAVQTILDDGLAKPILIGRPQVVAARMKKLGLRFSLGEDVEMVNILSDPRYRDYWTLYHQLMERRGVTPDEAKAIARANSTVIASLMVKRKEADALICGTVGRYNDHLKHITDVIGCQPHIKHLAAMSLVILPTGTFFICDTYVSPNPSAEHIAEITLLAAQEVQRFGIEPKVALLSHSNFGTSDSESALKMRKALSLINQKNPDLEVEGEMHADAALDTELRNKLFPNSNLKGQANLLIMPCLDAANITLNTLKSVADGLSVGPILLGTNLPAHILTPTATVRRIVNMCALAAVDAQLIES